LRRSLLLLIFLLVVFVGQAQPQASPPAPAAKSAPVRVTSNPEDDEDPSLLLARDGRFYAVWSGRQGSQAHLVLRTSRNGQSWVEERRLTDGDVEDFYPSLMQAEDGTFHLAWFRLRRTEGRVDVWTLRSADGVHWTDPAAFTVDGQSWAPTLYEDEGGGLWIVWTSWRTGNRELYTARSDDGGQTWSSPAPFANGPEEDDFAHVLTMPSGARILVWTRYASGTGITDFFDGSSEIVAATSRDGLAWAAPSLVSQADPGARYADALPFVFADRDRARFFVSWTSNRAQIARGDLVVRKLFVPSSVQQLATGGYSAKIVPTRKRGEFLMLWVAAGTAGKTDIFARRFRL
jgi:hypothetical protein